MSGLKFGRDVSQRNADTKCWAQVLEYSSNKTFRNEISDLKISIALNFQTGLKFPRENFFKKSETQNATN